MMERACVLCNNCTDDILQFGEKNTYEDTTAHLYCLLLTSNLVQNGDDDEGISGFMPKDIKAEVSRTKKLLCYYCQGKSATIGCCVKSCRRSFHLPCGLENDCRFEFTNTFRSFCDLHHDIEKPKNAHKPTDLCTVCYDEMGPYNPVRSIPLPCCNKNAWCHKLCLQKYAQTSGYFLKCPLCNDSNHFREFISGRGVFIPDRDAKWEVEDSGPNSFYSFEQHSERPSECEAKICKCKRGRKYQVDIEHHKHSLEFCEYCGSHAVHLGCINVDKYLCEECTVVAAKVENARIISLTTQPTSSSIGTNGSNVGRCGPQSPTFKLLAAKYKLRECHIRLTRLTQRDLGLTLVSNDCEYEAANTSTRCSMSSSSSTVDKRAYASSSDESNINIKPCATHMNRKLSRLFVSESDTEEDVVPNKKLRLSITNSFIDSDTEQTRPEFDINDNTRNVPSSNLVTPNKTNISLVSSLKPIKSDFREHQSSSSEEEQIKPTGLLISCKPICFESSDDQVFGNENEKPCKNIAVVRPFSRNDTCSDSSSIIIKPAKIKPRSRKMLSSSDETFNDLPETVTSPKGDHSVTKMETILINTSVDGITTPSVARAKIKLSPSKRKHRSVLSYFRDASSSEEEVHEQKSKKKSPKLKIRSPANTVPANQSTIMQFFKKHVSSHI